MSGSRRNCSHSGILLIVELFFDALLVLCTLAIVSFSVYVLVALFKGQN